VHNTVCLVYVATMGWTCSLSGSVCFLIRLSMGTGRNAIQKSGGGGGLLLSVAYVRESRSSKPCHVEREFNTHWKLHDQCTREDTRYAALKDGKVSSRGQLTRSGPLAWELGEGLTTLHRKKNSLLENVT